MSAPPLSHHDIVALVEPFARRGRHVDLAASQRHERRLVFKPRALQGDEPHAGVPCDRLQLEDLGRGSYRMSRTLERADGLRATLQAQGGDVAVLLADVDAVPFERHFVDGPGFTIARSYVVERAGAGAPEVRLTQGRVHVDGVVLTLDVAAVRRMAGDIALEPAAGDGRPALPEDLLAVLGWNWARLVAVRQGWTSKLRLRGSAHERTAQAEAALDVAAVHLARTFAEPPARFHERLKAARVGVFFRRGIPTFTAVGLFGAVGLLSLLFDEIPMTVWVPLYHVPTVIVAVSFLLQELPRFEIPPWPRPLRGASWHDAAALAKTR